MRTLAFAPHRQGGITLIVVMIALASLALASVALIRSIDTGTLVMGNLGFKQATTAQADRSVESAMTWIATKLTTAPTDLYTSRCPSGCTTADSTAAYYATSLEALDITGRSTSTSRAIIDWDNNNCSYATSGTYSVCLKASPEYTATDARGNTFAKTRHIIARMCKAEGDPNDSANNCAQPVSGSTASLQINKGEQKYGNTTMLSGAGGGASNTILMFRIIVRAQGPRNTISFTETYVNTVSQ